MVISKKGKKKTKKNKTKPPTETGIIKNEQQTFANFLKSQLSESNTYVKWGCMLKCFATVIEPGLILVSLFEYLTILIQ